jgi:hypothetical protein
MDFAYVGGCCILPINKPWIRHRWSTKDINFISKGSTIDHTLYIHFVITKENASPFDQKHISEFWRLKNLHSSGHLFLVAYWQVRKEMSATDIPCSKLRSILPLTFETKPTSIPSLCERNIQRIYNVSVGPQRFHGLQLLFSHVRMEDWTFLTWIWSLTWIPTGDLNSPMAASSLFGDPRKDDSWETERPSEVRP